MSRKAKGRVAPAPVLMPVAQRVADEVAHMPDVAVQAHWEIGSQQDVNGTDFYVGEHELGHIHLDGDAHIPLGRAVVDALVAGRHARRFRWSPEFVSVDVTKNPDSAAWIFALRHAAIHGASVAELLTQIDARGRR